MEEWRDVVGAEGLYEVSNLGEVRNAQTKHILKTQDQHGYRRLNLRINGKDKHCAVHRLVAAAFIPNPENKPQVNHLDGVHDNNHVDNLEWVTPEENFRHAVDNDLYKKGIEAAKELGHGRYNRKDRPRAYLKKSEVITRKGYESLIGVAEEFDLSGTQLAAIIKKSLGGARFTLSDNKTELIATSFYAKELARPQEKEIATLRQENERLRERLSGKNRKLCSSVGVSNQEYAIGQKRNHLKIIGYAKDDSGATKLVCRCDCGNIKLEQQFMWLSGKVKSCGCMREDLLSEAATKDVAESKRKEDWLYTLWCRHHRKSIWSDQWKEYNAFYEWSYSNGYNPGMHLHRINTADGFHPENCVWKEKVQQVKAEKPRYAVNGEMLTVAEACRKYGMIGETVRYRMRRGMSLEEAVNTAKCSNGRKAKGLSA